MTTLGDYDPEWEDDPSSLQEPQRQEGSSGSGPSRARAAGPSLGVSDRAEALPEEAKDGEGDVLPVSGLIEEIGRQPEPGWYGLPAELVAVLVPYFPGPLQLQAAFDSEDQASSLLLDIMGTSTMAFGLAGLGRLQGWATDLEAWRVSQARSFKRARSSRMAHGISHGVRLSTEKRAPEPKASSMGLYLVPTIALAAKRTRSRLQKMLDKVDGTDGGLTRAAVEKQERDRWAGLLWEYIQRADMPVVMEVLATTDPDSAKLRLFGALRARTLRNRAHVWAKVSSWLRMVKGRTHPQSTADMLDYLDAVELTVSAPDAIAAALYLLERVGGLPADRRISQSQVWIASVKAHKLELEQGSAGARKARMPTVAMILSWEMEVMDVSQVLCYRITAWCRLLKTWLCLRSDDLQGIELDSIRIGEFCTSMKLTRSKTTGAGKKVKEVRMYMSHLCSLSGQPWMATGLAALKDSLPSGARDFLLPGFGPNGDTFRRKMMSYSEASALSRGLSAQLRIPVRGKSGAWQLVAGSRLLPDELGKLFTEHSERHFLPSVAAEAGEGAERRSFLGRWGIDSYAGSEYNLSARQIVIDLQGKVVRFLNEGKPGHDETELLEEIAETCKAAGLDHVAIVRGHTVLFGTPGASGRSLHQMTAGMGPPAAAEEQPVELPPSEALVATSEAKESPSPFWVSVARRTKHRKLHRSGGCGILRWEVHHHEDVEKLTSSCADSFCKACWPAKFNPDGKAPWEQADAEASLEQVSSAGSEEESSSDSDSSVAA